MIFGGRHQGAPRLVRLVRWLLSRVLVSLQNGLPLSRNGGIFHIEAFRFRGLAVVLCLCGLIAGLCWTLAPEGPQSTLSIDQHFHANQNQHRPETPLQGVR